MTNGTENEMKRDALFFTQGILQQLDSESGIAAEDKEKIYSSTLINFFKNYSSIMSEDNKVTKKEVRKQMKKFAEELEEAYGIKPDIPGLAKKVPLYKKINESFSGAFRTVLSTGLLLLPGVFIWVGAKIFGKDKLWTGWKDRMKKFREGKE